MLCDDGITIINHTNNPIHIFDMTWLQTESYSRFFFKRRGTLFILWLSLLALEDFLHDLWLAALLWKIKVPLFTTKYLSFYKSCYSYVKVTGYRWNLTAFMTWLWLRLMMYVINVAFKDFWSCFLDTWYKTF